MSDIHSLHLEQLGRIVTGKTPKTSRQDFWGGSIPFYTPSDMNGARYLDKVERYITNEGLATIRNCFLPKNSILVSCIGSDMGKVAINLHDGVSNQQINSIIPNIDIVDPKYLYYELSSRKKEFQLLASGGSAQPILNKGNFSRIKIRLPDLKKQKAIAQILDSLDAKIELNEKLNLSLDGIGRSIFKSWFIDHDFLNDNIKNHLSVEIKNLFPSKLNEGDLGSLPSGWELKTFSECGLEIESGRRPKGGIDKNLTEGVPSVGAESIDAIGVFDYSKVKYVTSDFASRLGRGWVQNYDVALYKDGGKPGQFIPRVGLYGDGFPFDKFLVNEHVFLLRSKFLGQFYLYYLISSDSILTQLIAKASAKAAQPGLNQEEVMSTVFVCPDNAVLQKFNEVVDPIIKQQLILGKETLVLKKMLEIFIPRLISEEISISEVERFLGEAGI